jgi:hypothetical protein
MDIISLTPDCYEDWDAFSLGCDHAWFWHTTAWLDYTLAYRPDLTPASKSFMVVDGGQVQAICPLILEEFPTGGDGNGVREFSFGGGFGPPPAFSTQTQDDPRVKQAVADACFDQIDELAREFNVGRVSFAIPPLAKSSWDSQVSPENWLARRGYADVSIHTQVIDLSLTPTDLLGGMRKGHRSDVKRGSKQMEIVALGADEISRDQFDQYQALHQLAAGRVTRPQSTFDSMFEWIKSGNGALICAKYDGDFVAFALLTVYKDGAYYGSSCTHPDYARTQAGHGIQWRAMEWLREHGVHRYDLGWQQFGPLPYDFPTDKELAIAHFKRGFGGDTVPFFRAEKFYSTAYYGSITADRAKAYVAAIASKEAARGSS